MPFYARLLLAILAVAFASEFAPEVINWLLVIVLIGLVLSNPGTFSKAIQTISTTK